MASKCPLLEGLLSHWWGMVLGTELRVSHVLGNCSTMKLHIFRSLPFYFLFSVKVSLHHLSWPWTCSVAPASLDFTILPLCSPDQLDLQDILLGLPDYMLLWRLGRESFFLVQALKLLVIPYIEEYWSFCQWILQSLICHIPCSNAAGLYLSYVLPLFCFSYLLVCTCHHHKLTELVHGICREEIHTYVHTPMHYK